MTRAEQIRFVRELSSNICEDIKKTILSGSIPETWDGHELRVWLSDRHAESAALSRIKQEPKSQRARAYRNVKTINPRM